MKFGTRVRLKPYNDRGKFELDRAKSKNNIAENSIALGHETHNNTGAVRLGLSYLLLKEDIKPSVWTRIISQSRL